MAIVWRVRWRRATFAALTQSARDNEIEEAATVVAAVEAHGGNPTHLRIGRILNAVTRLSPKLGGWLAVQLFTRPRRLPVGEQSRVALADAERLELRDGVRLVGYRWGAPQGSPRVLLIHGWESHSARWLPLQARLTQIGATVTALDGPAAGASGGRRTPFNRYVAAALAFERAHGPFDVYVGHSLGGGVAVQLAARVRAERRPRAAVAMAAFDESEHVFDRYHAMLGLRGHVRVAFDRSISRELDAGESVRDYSNTAAAARLVGVRGLVVHSEDDAVSPFAGGLAIRDAWPGAEFHAYRRQGHALRSEAVEEAVAAWVLANGRPTTGA